MYWRIGAVTKKLTTQEFIERTQKTHGKKYDYSKIRYINNKKEKRFQFLDKLVGRELCQ